MALRRYAMLIALMAFAPSLLDHFHNPSTQTVTRSTSRALPPRPAVEDPDHPHARWEWELERLADPATGRIPPNIHHREQVFASKLPRRPPGSPFGMNETMKRADSWTYRGPSNVGGRTRALAVDVADPTLQTLVAGGVSGGMWRSEDDGASWELTTGSSQLHSVTTVAQDTRPGHENVWYYGTGEARKASADWNGGKYWGDGLFKSTDGARSWTQLASTSSQVPQDFDQPWDAVWRVAIDPSNLAQAEVYAATHGIIYRSTDGGQIWTAVLGDPTQLSKYSDIVVDPNGVVYATLSTDGGQHGIFRSTDGLTWSRINPAGLDSGHDRITMAIAPTNPDLVYFLVSDTANPVDSQLWRYEYVNGDGSGAGGSWEDRSAALGQLPSIWSDAYDGSLVTQRGYNLVVAVSPTDASTVYVGGVHLWRSTSGFSNHLDTVRIGGWLYEGESQHADQHWLAFRPGSDRVLYVSSDGGVHRTDDAVAGTVQWDDLNNGYNTTQFYTVAIDQEAPGDPVIVGGTQDNGTQWTGSADGLSPWVEVYGGDGAFCSVLSAADGDYLVSYYYGNVVRIQIGPDGAVLRETTVNPANAGDYEFINPFITDPLDEHIVYQATSNGVWRNDDLTLIPWDRLEAATEGWSHLTHQPTGAAITALAINDEPGATLYYGTEDGRLYAVPDGRNAPAPQTPVALHDGAGFTPGAHLSNIAVHPDDDDRLLVSFGSYKVPSLWYSVDGGKSWTDVEGNLAGDDGPSVRCVTIVPQNGGDLWVCGTSTGIYSLQVDGVAGPDPEPVWTQEAPLEVGNVVVDALAVRMSDGTLVAATHGRGVFSATVATSVPVLTVDLIAEPVDEGVRIEWMGPEALRPSAVHVRRRSEDTASRVVAELDGQARGSWLDRDAAALAGRDLYYSVILEEGTRTAASDEVHVRSGTPQPHAHSRSRLLPNVPNPFNPATELRFHLARAGDARLDVFELSGRRVRTLHVRGLGPGEHGVSWRGLDDQGRAVSSGVYLVRLVTADAQDHQRVVLIR